MTRFIEEASRTQTTLFPVRLDEYVSPDNAVRVVDAFVEGLDLRALKFERVDPKATGRPGYHPATLLKLYIYGYLNRIQSSRRLEREANRNVELMWLIGGLHPDFKTIADFRKDNGPGIQNVCRQFVEICRQLDLFSNAMVAIDGSKFKAVNSKQRNDSRKSIRRRIERAEKHIARYLEALDEKDSEEPTADESEIPELQSKLEAMQEKLQSLKEREKAVLAHPDKQISHTDPDSRLMKKGGLGSIVGYNVQTAIDSKYKLIVAHEVTNSPVDRGQLAPIAKLVHDTLQVSELTALADRGYYKGSDILWCYEAGITTLVPKSQTSNSKAAGLFDKADFIYEPDEDQYRCPAGEILKWRQRTFEDGLNVDRYYASQATCRECKLKSKCTVGKERRVRRWEHEDVLDMTAEKLKQMPDAMVKRASIAEHPFGTMKFRMGSTHFLMKGLPNVKTEMSLHVLVYNLTRMISILGVTGLIEALKRYGSLFLRILEGNIRLSKPLLENIWSGVRHSLRFRRESAGALGLI